MEGVRVAGIDEVLGEGEVAGVGGEDPGGVGFEDVGDAGEGGVAGGEGKGGKGTGGGAGVLGEGVDGGGVGGGQGGGRLGRRVFCVSCRSGVGGIHGASSGWSMFCYRVPSSGVLRVGRSFR